MFTVALIAHLYHELQCVIQLGEKKPLVWIESHNVDRISVLTTLNYTTLGSQLFNNYFDINVFTVSTLKCLCLL